MKKLAILTSILALAACGGGSGGHGTPGEILTPEQRVAAESNLSVTGMKSHIIIGGTNATVNPNARASTSGGHGGKLYDLSNVVFQSADKEFDAPDEDFTMKFIVDENGKITAIQSTDDGSIDEFARHDDKSNRFDVPEEGVHHARVNLVGKQLGLAYSDFGFIQMYEDANPDTHLFIMPIAGGYQEKLVKADELATDMKFRGIAVGSVGEADTTVEGERLDLYDSKAELVFNKETGTETLTADFTSKSHQNDPWYKVVATRYNDGDAQIAFTDGGNIEKERFMFHKNGDAVESFDSGKVKNNDAGNMLSVGFEYFGDNKTAQEATGIIYFQQSEAQDPSEDPNRIDLYMGFGGIANK